MNKRTGIEKAAYYARQSILRVRVGAYVDGPSGLVGAWNTRKSHPALVKLGYPSWSNRHSEVALMLMAGRDRLRGQDVFVARLLRDGAWALARPCQYCMTMLAGERVRSVTWTVGPDKWEGLIL